MRLTFEVPTGWSMQYAGEEVTVRHGASGSRIVGAPLLPKGIDPRVVIEANRPADSQVEDVETIDSLESRAGWRMKLVTLEIRDVVGNRIETRLAAIYEMTHYLGIAVGFLATEQDRPALLEILFGARPQLWPDEIVCVAELWSMEDA